MKPRSIWTLFGKLALVTAPFILLFIFITLRTPYLTDIQTNRVNDTIKELVSSTSTLQVIIAGDSRAAYNVIPAIFTKESGLSSANVGSGGETLSQTYEILSSNQALNKKRLILLSVSVYDISDTFFDAQHDDTKVIEQEPWSKQKIKDILTYFHAFVDYYIDNFKNVIRFNIKDNTRLSDAQLKAAGYSQQDGAVTVQSGETLPNPDSSWYANIRTNGFHQAEFVQSLKNLGATNNTVIIYIGPLAPEWNEASENPDIQAADKAFAQIITQTIAPYPNLHFIDFQSQNIPSLTNAQFTERVHLNLDGATIFTKLLVDTLIEDGIIK